MTFELPAVSFVCQRDQHDLCSPQSLRCMCSCHLWAALVDGNLAAVSGLVESPPDPTGTAGGAPRLPLLPNLYRECD